MVSVDEKKIEKSIDDKEIASHAFRRLATLLLEIAQNNTATYQPDNDKYHLPQEKPPLASKSKNKKGGKENDNLAECVG